MRKLSLLLVILALLFISGCVHRIDTVSYIDPVPPTYTMIEYPYHIKILTVQGHRYPVIINHKAHLRVHHPAKPKYIRHPHHPKRSHRR